MERKKHGIKHLIQCRCILPQFKSQYNTNIFHKFIVFSIIDETDNVIQKLVQCNNCIVIHDVYDIYKSNILQEKEEVKSLITIDDLKLSLPEKLSNILEHNKTSLYNWEHVKFIVENEYWDDEVILNSEISNNVCYGKKLIIKGINEFTIETFSETYLV